MFTCVNHIPEFLRRWLLAIALAFSAILGTTPAIAAPETPAQARLHHDQAKVRSMARSVVEFILEADAQTTYRGSGVYVENNGSLFLLTCNHVVTVEGKLPENLGEKLRFRAYTADPDDAAEWHRAGQYANQIKRVPGADFAILVLSKPIEGMVPAKLAAFDAASGDEVIAFGYAAADGHMLRGKVTGKEADSGNFIALKIGADHGDSGGPIFDAATGRVVGLVSSSAAPEMTEHFSVRHDADHQQATWTPDATPMSADTLAVHLPEVLAK